MSIARARVRRQLCVREIQLESRMESRIDKGRPGVTLRSRCRHESDLRRSISASPMPTCARRLGHNQSKSTHADVCGVCWAWARPSLSHMQGDDGPVHGTARRGSTAAPTPTPTPTTNPNAATVSVWSPSRLSPTPNPIPTPTPNPNPPVGAALCTGRCRRQ